MQNYVPRINEGGDLKKKPKTPKEHFFLRLGPKDTDVPAAEQSKEVTAAWTGLGVPAQKEFA